MESQMLSLFRTLLILISSGGVVNIVDAVRTLFLGSIKFNFKSGYIP